VRVDDADMPGVKTSRDLALLRHLNPEWTDKGAAAQPVHMAIITVRGADGGEGKAATWRPAAAKRAKTAVQYRDRARVLRVLVPIDAERQAEREILAASEEARNAAMLEDARTTVERKMAEAIVAEQHDDAVAAAKGKRKRGLWEEELGRADHVVTTAKGRTLCNTPGCKTFATRKALLGTTKDQGKMKMQALKEASRGQISTFEKLCAKCAVTREGERWWWCSVCLWLRAH
jgi:hypothetical protein